MQIISIEQKPTLISLQQKEAGVQKTHKTNNNIKTDIQQKKTCDNEKVTM